MRRLGWPSLSSQAGKALEESESMAYGITYNAAVLVSESDWRAVQETPYVNSIPGMRASIRRGLKTPVGKCHAEPGW